MADRTALASASTSTAVRRLPQRLQHRSARLLAAERPARPAGHDRDPLRRGALRDVGRVALAGIRACGSTTAPAAAGGSTWRRACAAFRFGEATRAARPAIPEWDQRQTLGLSLYVPLYTGCSWSPDAYTTRSVMSGGLICQFDFLGKDFSMPQAQAAIAEARACRKFWYGDFYPLREGVAGFRRLDGDAVPPRRTECRSRDGLPPRPKRLRLDASRPARRSNRRGDTASSSSTNRGKSRRERYPDANWPTGSS